VFNFNVARVQAVSRVLADAKPVAQEIIRPHDKILLERQIIFVAQKRAVQHEADVAVNVVFLERRMTARDVNFLSLCISLSASLKK